jgi:hypothetical protein
VVVVAAAAAVVVVVVVVVTVVVVLAAVTVAGQLSKNVKISMNKNMILPVVLHRCETWSLILTEKYRLRVFENRVLRRILGPKREEVTGAWRKLHNEELRNFPPRPV